MTPTGSTYTRTYPRAAVLPHRVFSPRKPCQQIHTGKQAESCGGKPDPDSRRASRRKGGNILGKDAARKPLRKPPEPPIPDAASWPQLPLPPHPPFPAHSLAARCVFGQESARFYSVNGRVRPSSSRAPLREWPPRGTSFIVSIRGPRGGNLSHQAGVA